jgi:hypothetical protein
MGLAFAVVLIWLGCALLWVAAHGTQAAKPWQAFTEVTDAMRGGE